MTASENRLARLTNWIEDQFSGNTAAFCRYYNLKRSMASFIYQISGGNRIFGERAARSLELACGRPEGWLDMPIEQGSVDPLQYDRALCRQLPVRERQLIEDFIKLVLARNNSTGRLGAGTGVFLRASDIERSAQIKKPQKRALNINEPSSSPSKRRSTR